ncbi:alpha/beta hydrolase family protein [Spongorhabdus nitratireducens]
MQTSRETSDVTQRAIDTLLHGCARPTHSPILKTPADYGLSFEDITFRASDGLMLEGWFIPAESDRLIISNHFSPGNRYGYAGHLDEFKNPAGEINAIPRYKALHDAGYNVLTYDSRGHGASPDPEDGIIGLGLKEWQDVAGSLQFAQSDDRMKKMQISMMNICMGGNSALIAMGKRPELFKQVKSQILMQPFNMRSMVEKGFSLMNADIARLAEFEALYVQTSGYDLDDHDMRKHISSVTMPTMLVQVRGDVSIDVSYIEDIYKALPVEDKTMFWIEGSVLRFDAYKYFSEKPAAMINWFNQHML